METPAKPASTETEELTNEDHTAIKALKAFGLSNARIAQACCVMPEDVDAALAGFAATGFVLSRQEKAEALATICEIKALEYLLQCPY